MAYQYEDSLPPDALGRYKAKLKLIGMDICPYKIAADRWQDDVKKWPKLQYPDLFNYLINFPRVYSTESMKNYKSLEAYQFFLSGWVQTIMHLFTSTSTFLATASVRPSWRVTDEPHHPWVALTRDGTVVAAHCDCMAGLGESCSHVGAVLYKIEAAVRLGYTETLCTDIPCSWNQNFTRNIVAQPISEIRFYRTEAHKRILESSKPAKRAKKHATPEQQQAFLASLAAHGQCVGLSGFEQHNERFIVKEAAKPPTHLPQSLRGLYKDEHSKASNAQLDKACNDVLASITNITREEAAYVEAATRAQSSSSHWYEMRAGRITASAAHGLLNTKPDAPAPSLIKKVCIPGRPLTVPAVMWGVEHEAHAFHLYKHLRCGEPLPDKCPVPEDIRFAPDILAHEHSIVEHSGLVIDPDISYIGASPDGVVTCDCCGKGVLEIKCPYKWRHSTLTEAVQDRDFCLDTDMQLKPSHSYYTQVQMQMHVCGALYANLMIWTLKEGLTIRVMKDMTFLEGALPKLQHIWRTAILPELLTRNLEHGSTSDKENSPPQLSQQPTSDAPPTYCVCRSTDDSGAMVGCDRCEDWFHLSCLKLKRMPTSKTWYCPKCRKARKSLSKR